MTRHRSLDQVFLSAINSQNPVLNVRYTRVTATSVLSYMYALLMAASMSID